MSSSKADVRKVGRPTKYTPELGKLICERIATHDIGLTKLCAIYEDMPARSNLYEWLHKYQDFQDMYAKAKVSQIQILIEEIVDISDNSSKDSTINGQGVSVCNSEFIARSRLRVDTRKWLASKLMPRLYGDRTVVQNESTEETEALKKELKELRARLAQETVKSY